MTVTISDPGSNKYIGNVRISYLTLMHNFWQSSSWYREFMWHRQYQYTPMKDATHARNTDSSDSLMILGVTPTKLKHLYAFEERLTGRLARDTSALFHCDQRSVEEPSHSHLTVASSTALCPRRLGSQVNTLPWICPHTAVSSLLER